MVKEYFTDETAAESEEDDIVAEAATAAAAADAAHAADTTNVHGIADFAALLASVTPTAWTGVTFANSWENAAGGSQAVQYRKVGDLVSIRGQVKSTGIMSALTAMFTLPAGFRPPVAVKSLVAVVISGLVGARLDIGADGVVALNSAVIANDEASIMVEFSITA